MSTSTIAGTVDAPVWRLALASVLPTRLRPRADRWIQHFPLLLLVTVQGLLSLRLGNTAFQDEALYVLAGQEILAHWLTGAPVIDYGSFFSGVPVAYPVLAGLLQYVGGLPLVRAFSLGCVVVTMLCVRDTSKYLYGQAAGNLAGFTFAVTGPVVYTSALATFDALCLCLLSVGIWLGVTRSSRSSAALAGVAVAAAAIVKYTGAAFLPVVLAAVLFGDPQQKAANRLLRTVTTALVAAAVLAGLYALWGEEVREGILFTTTGREALSPAPLSQLLGYVAQDIGLSAALAVLGGLLVARSLRSSLFVLALFAGASGLLVGQLHLGEAVSFEKHMAYSALFLAPLAGRALAELARPSLRGILLAAIMWILLVSGLARSHTMHYEWPNVERVVSLMAEDSPPGRYLSTQSLPLSFYTRDEFPDIQWVEHYGLFDSGPGAIRNAVENRAFEMIVWRSGSTGNPTEDAQLAVLQEAVIGSPHYDLAAEPFPVRQWSEQDWYIFQLNR
ncbi:glycosyltransferase family 39 protein [Kocuria turfanensis]|uniref:Glycosyltransferase RgtA/B/C/D-like domain-containing protein n=1 Tax=Kocuria turfanensis TaxID=388357 RepID=A0A512IAB7_9MICC|nr:glycosyltransferase family 39 protein [Kocuria turfanensis]GEO94643.1 hypothetical protein KTU01_07660 [Kocuria turfanensis]